MLSLYTGTFLIVYSYSAPFHSLAHLSRVYTILLTCLNEKKRNCYIFSTKHRKTLKFCGKCRQITGVIRFSLRLLILEILEWSSQNQPPFYPCNFWTNILNMPPRPLYTYLLYGRPINYRFFHDKLKTFIL